MNIIPENLVAAFKERQRLEPTRQISFLLGSGFSRADKMPLVGEINARLTGMGVDDFYLRQDMSAGFYNGDYRDPNAKMSTIKRRFAVAFIQFYISSVLDGAVGNFNYEVFFDYFNEFFYEKRHQDEITGFWEAFVRENNLGNRFDKPRQLISDFLNLFNQLVASLLIRARHYENASWTGAYTNYEYFCIAMNGLLKERIVNVHSLNHDILFDWIGTNVTGFWDYFTDGFSEMESPYYGELRKDYRIDDRDVYKTYKVRVPKYTGMYNNRLKFYKLHGSVNYYALTLAESGEQLMVKRDYGVGEMYREHFNERIKKFEYDSPFSRQYPSYLTGTTQKIIRYAEPFYNNLFDHFKSNLKNSEQLIVIGYGFQDKGINEILETDYLKTGKSIIVIDVRIPSSELIDKYKDQFRFEIGSVSDIHHDVYYKYIGL